MLGCLVTGTIDELDFFIEKKTTLKRGLLRAHLKSETLSSEKII